MRRIGIVHAALNTGAATLFGASLPARKRGARGGGRRSRSPAPACSAPPATSAATSPTREGVGVNETAFEDGPDEWTAALRESDLPEGESRYAEVGGVGVMVARWEGEIHALSNHCAHRGGPLDEGELADGCVTCPLHGSRSGSPTAASSRARAPTRSRAGTCACATA